MTAYRNKLARIGESVDQYKDRRKSETKLTSERRLVRALVRRLGATAQAGIDRDDENEQYMLFSWFYSRFPSFPVRLAAYEVWAPTLYDFFKLSNRNTDIWPKWYDLQDAVGTDKPIGLIFPFPANVGLNIGVIHNTILPDPPTDFAQLRRKFGHEYVYLDTIDSFAERVLMLWEPT